MDSKLFFPAKLKFSEYSRCLNFQLWILWPAKTKQVQESNLFCDTAPTKSCKLKHLKFSENVNFVETNSVDSILVPKFLQNQAYFFPYTVHVLINVSNDAGLFRLITPDDTWKNGETIEIEEVCSALCKSLNSGLALFRLA